VSKCAVPSFLVFSDDWGRHPSSCQHLFGQLLGRYRVHWVNTIGTRTHQFNLATVRRGFEKVKQWLGRSGRAEADTFLKPEVLQPRMWPWFGSRFDRRLNRWLLTKQLRTALAGLPEPPVAVTTLPIVADLMDDLPVRRWVYYCVDDFGEWPGLDGTTLRRLEQIVVKKADRIIAVSETLQARLEKMGRSSRLLTHGVDLDFWQDTAGGLAKVAHLERPLIVFWGVVDRRMDLSFLTQLARDLSKGTIVLAGPQAEPDRALANIPRVVQIGKLSFTELPLLASDATVLIMPYADLPVTRMMQPLKLKEYLATGKPAVVRSLPSTEAWADCADVVGTPTAFSQAVLARLGGLPASQRAARSRLIHESWADKARVFRELLLDASADDCRCRPPSHLSHAYANAVA
jgi:glycosyltransferase involved in cell wall biosynthesis